MNPVFTGLAAVLAGGVALWLSSVLWRGRKTTESVAYHSVNAAVLQDQLAELERDVANQTLSTDDFSSARQELQRRALQEAAPDAHAARNSGRDTWSAAAMLLILPFAALALYFYLGSPGAMQPAAPEPPRTLTQTDVQSMVESLEARLAQNPDDPEGWLMLGRSYRYFGRYKEAADAYFKAAPVVQMSAAALAEYAEALARSSGTGFTKEAISQLERALTIDPQEPFALTLAGTAAFENGNYTEAIDHWGRVLEQLPPESDAAKAVSEGIETARIQALNEDARQ